MDRTADQGSVYLRVINTYGWEIFMDFVDVDPAVLRVLVDISVVPTTGDQPRRWDWQSLVFPIVSLWRSTPLVPSSLLHLGS